MFKNWNVIEGDCRNMSLLKNNLIDIVITSPPYWKIKNYGTEDQIGFWSSYDEYIQDLNKVWSECKRVSKNDAVICINIGDMFTRTTEYGRHKIISISSNIIDWYENNGYNFFGKIVWKKIQTKKTTGGASVMGSYPTPKNGLIDITNEWILLFSQKDYKKRFDVWNFAGTKQKEHPAMFPLKLPELILNEYANKQSVILDPFSGSGTTLLAAINENLDCYGYEINENYIDVIKSKIGYKETDGRFSYNKEY